MRSGNRVRGVFRVAEFLVVGAAVAVLTVQPLQSDAYREYCRAGGRNGFWSWFAKEKCGVTLPGVEDRDAAFAEEREKAKTEAAQERKETLAKLEARERELVAAEAKERKRLGAAGRVREGQSPFRVVVGKREGMKVCGRSSFTAA